MQSLAPWLAALFIQEVSLFVEVSSISQECIGGRLGIREGGGEEKSCEVSRLITLTRMLSTLYQQAFNTKYPTTIQKHNG